MNHTDTLERPAAADPVGTLAISAGLLVVAIGAGLAGLGALGGENSVDAWGMLTVNWLYLLGITQYGVAFTAIMRICGAGWSRPFYRLGELVTLAFAPLSLLVFLALYFFGRHQLFYWVSASPDEHLSPWLNETFLLWRNLIAQLMFYAAALAYTLTGMRADKAGTSARSAARARRTVYYWSPVMLVLVMIVQTFASWDFAMMLTAHWHSTVFPMHFMMGSMYAGTALLLLMSFVLVRGPRGLQLFGRMQIKSIGIMLTAFMCLWLYLFWAQFFVTWFGNLPEETRPVFKMMTGHYQPLFLVQLACLFALPLAALIFAPVKRSRWLLGTVAGIICVGIWVNRYLMVLPVFSDTHQPFTTVADIALTVALIAAYFAILLALIRTVPIVMEWELAPGAEGYPE